MAEIREDQEDERVKLEIDMGLFDQVSELIAPMHISHEELITAFLEWCVDSVTRDTAIAWLQTAMIDEMKNCH